MRAIAFFLAMMAFAVASKAQQPTIDGDFYPSYDGSAILGLGISKFQGAVIVGEKMYKIRPGTKKELLGFRTFEQVTLITENGIVTGYSLLFDGIDWIPMFAKLVDRYGIYDRLEEEDDGMPTIYWEGYKIYLSLLIFKRTQFALFASIRMD